MDATSQAQQVQYLETQLRSRELVCTLLASEFATSISGQERKEIAFLWDQMLRECYVLRLTLDLSCGNGSEVN